MANNDYVQREPASKVKEVINQINIIQFRNKE